MPLNQPNQISRIQVRRSHSNFWLAQNPTLADGEIGFETNTGKFKIGSNNVVWSDLDYSTSNLDTLEHNFDFSPTVAAEWSIITDDMWPGEQGTEIDTTPLAGGVTFKGGTGQLRNRAWDRTIDPERNLYNFANNHPGVRLLGAGGAGNQAILRNQHYWNDGPIAGDGYSYTKEFFEVQISFPIAPTALENFKVYFGLCDGTSQYTYTNPHNGVCWVLKRDLLGNPAFGIERWVYGLQTTYLSFVPAAINTWYTLRMEKLNGGGYLKLFINGVEFLPNTVPSGYISIGGEGHGVTAAWLQKTVGTAFREIAIDYYKHGVGVTR